MVNKIAIGVVVVLVLAVLGVLIWYFTKGSDESTPATTPDPVIYGRYVRISRPTDSSIHEHYLNFGELKIFIKDPNGVLDDNKITVDLKDGTRVTNVAIGKTVTGSSEHSSLLLKNLVDNSAGTFAHNINLSDNPAWFEVDLGKEYPIHRIHIKNRHNCCLDRAINATVIIKNASNTKVWESDKFTKATKIYNMDPTTTDTSVKEIDG